MKPKVLFHGTSSAYLDSIMEHGLKYVPEHRWKVLGYPTTQTGRLVPGTGDKPGYVYLTDVERAVSYAMVRTLYDRVEVGGYFPWDWGAEIVECQKMGGRVYPNADPVLLSVPFKVLDRKLFDEDPFDQVADRYYGIIPPSDITVVWNKPWRVRNPFAERRAA